MRRDFHTLDVFTDRPLSGNPLAVVHDARGLDTGAMQRIAREFNLSETVFVMPPADPANTAAIRIFTPGSELPFAGHPTVGTAVILAKLRAGDMLGGAGIDIVLEESIGLVRVAVTERQGEAARGVFALPRLPSPQRVTGSISDIAAVLGLSDDDIGLDGHETTHFSNGVGYTHVPVRSLAALARARPLVGPAFDELFGAASEAAPYVYTADGPNRWRTRMFAPASGIPEDPATGSAAATFAGALVELTRPADGEHQHIIRQGYEMGRPSEIVLTLQVSGGRLVEATIGGSAVIVSEGWIDV